MFLFSFSPSLKVCRLEVLINPASKSKSSHIAQRLKVLGAWTSLLSASLTPRPGEPVPDMTRGKFLNNESPDWKYETH